MRSHLRASLKVLLRPETKTPMEIVDSQKSVLSASYFFLSPLALDLSKRSIDRTMVRKFSAPF